MPEAVINYVGEMPYRPGGAVDLYPFVPCFEVKIGDDLLFKVWVQLSWEGGVNATRQLERQALSENMAEEIVSRALVLYATGRLEQLVAEWLSTQVKPAKSSDVWNLTTEDVPHLLALVKDKTCSYQVRVQRDLYCTAASDKDSTLTGILINKRRSAPTSKVLCQDCGLPDTNFICSHLMHPKVSGMNTMGGIMDRNVMTAMCDKGHRDRVHQIRKCQAGGHECWQRIVEVDPPVVPLVSPLELAEAWDVLDAVWRLVFGKNKRLLSISSALVPAAISLDCTTREEFASRVNAAHQKMIM